MIGALAFLVLAPAQKVEDYFPITPGTKWTYEETTTVRIQYTDEILPPFAIFGKATVPIQTKRKDEILGVNFYRIEGDTVFLYATNKENALPDPVPFLKVGTKETTWNYVGQIPYGQGMLPVEQKATATPNGTLEVLGQNRETLKLVMDSKLKEGGGVVTIRCQSTAVYAKGIGMIEMTDSITYNKTKSTRKVKLVAFEPPK